MFLHPSVDIETVLVVVSPYCLHGLVLATPRASLGFSPYAPPPKSDGLGIKIGELIFVFLSAGMSLSMLPRLCREPVTYMLILET
jgi:hypothetical protein